MPRFTIEARVHLDVATEINAKDLAEAQEKSRELKVADFLDVTSEHNDSDFRIVGVREAYKGLKA